MKAAGVEEVEDLTGTEVMTEMEVMAGIKGMKNDVRKERRASRQRRLPEAKLGVDIRRLQNEKVAYWNNTFGVGTCISYSDDGKGGYRR
jgi:hypothetical protein